MRGIIQQQDAPFENLTSGEHRANLGRKALVAVGWNALQLWGYNLVGLGVFVVLGRLLSPDDFGLVACAVTIIWFMRIVVDAGFTRLLVQRSELDRIHADTAFWTAALLGVFFTVVTIAAAPAFAALYSQPRLTNLVRALSPVFIFAALDSTPTALLQRQLRYRTLAIRRLIASAISAVVAIVVAANGGGAWALVAQQLVLEGLAVAGLWFVTSWRPAMRFARAAFRELLTFGGQWSLFRIFAFLGSNVDNFLIGVVLGPVALGYYVIAYRVFVVLNELFAETITNVALPTFSRLKDDHSELNGVFYRSSALAAAVALPAYAGLAIVATDLVPTIFGAKWNPSAAVLELLTLAGVAQAMLAFSSSYVVAIGLIKRELSWTIVLTAAEVMGFGIAVHFGITAVAGALSVVLAAALPIRLVFLRACGGLDIQLYFRALMPPAVATAIMSAVMLVLHLVLGSLSHTTLLVVEVIVGAAIYPALLAVLAPAYVQAIRAGVSRFRSRPAAESV